MLGTTPSSNEISSNIQSKSEQKSKYLPNPSIHQEIISRRIFRDEKIMKSGKHVAIKLSWL